MAATPITTGPTLSDEEQRAMQVLNLSMRMLGVDDPEMGKRTGVSRSSIEGKRKGRSRIRIGEQTRRYADALNVPAELFTMDVLDAGAWLLANRSEQVIAASGWLAGIPGQESLFGPVAA